MLDRSRSGISEQKLGLTACPNLQLGPTNKVKACYRITSLFHRNQDFASFRPKWRKERTKGKEKKVRGFNVQFKGLLNQLSLSYGSNKRDEKRKTEQENRWAIRYGHKNPWDQSEKARETMVGRICGKGKFWVWSSGTEKVHKRKKFERVNILAVKYRWVAEQTLWVWLYEAPDYMLIVQH